MSVCLLDTSVFCEILEVPRKAQEPAKYRTELEHKIEGGETMLLPFATIVETGNHIGQVDGGDLRREAAKKFVVWLEAALDGKAPFTPIRWYDVDDARAWIHEFPDWAGRGIGLGDLTIKKEWESQCRKHRARRVYVWSKDLHLLACDQPATL